MANSNIDARMIRKIADSIGTKVAEQVAKSISAHLAKQGVKGRTGRGGNSNKKNPNQDVNALEGSGNVQSLKKLEDSIEEFNKSSKMFKGTKEALAGSLKFIRPLKAIQELMLENITRGAEQVRDREDPGSLFHDLASRSVEYIQASGTQIENLQKLTEAIVDQRKETHRISQTMASANPNVKKLNSDFTKLTHALENMKDASGNTIDMMQGLGVESMQTVADMKANGIEVDKTSDRYKEQQKVLAEMSAKLKDSADIVSEVTSSVTDSYSGMVRNQRMQFLTAFKVLASAIVYGGYQMINDWSRSFDLLVPVNADLKGSAIVMGMTMNELQEGMVQYRDTLRSESILLGRSVFDAQTLKETQRMGMAIGLSGVEAFNFGMRMKETASRLGMASQASEDSYATMMKTYKQGALAMNMSVSEFGDYLNDLSSDPAFVSIANVIRSRGGDVQAALQKEIVLRARTNKLLGMSNEQIKEQIMLENAKKWAPLTDKYMSEINSNLLVSQLEKVSGLDLSPKAEAALKQYSFNPQLMSKEQKKLFQTEVMPFLSLAQGIYDENMAQQTMDMSDPERLAFSKQQGVVQELIRTFGSNSGLLPILERSAIATANMEKIIAGTRFTKDDVFAALSGTLERTPENEELFSRIDTIMGAGKEEQELLNIQEEQVDLLKNLGFIKNILGGSVKNGLGKILLGMAGIAALLLKGSLIRSFGKGSIAGMGLGLLGKAFGTLRSSVITLNPSMQALAAKLGPGILGKFGLVGIVGAMSAGLATLAYHKLPGFSEAIADLIDGTIEFYDKIKNMLKRIKKWFGFEDEKDEPKYSTELQKEYNMNNEQAAAARRTRIIAKLKAGEYTAGYSTVAQIEKATGDQLASAWQQITKFNQERMSQAEVTEQAGSTGKNQTQLMEETNERLGQLVDKNNELVLYERDKKEATSNARQRLAEMQRVAAADAANWKNTINKAMAEAEANYSLHTA